MICVYGPECIDFSTNGIGVVTPTSCTVTETLNIHSMSGDGELMLTILASFAQAEAQSVSENCRWRIRKNFEAGIPVSTPIYGFKMKKGKFYLVPRKRKLSGRYSPCTWTAWAVQPLLSG